MKRPMREHEPLTVKFAERTQINTDSVILPALWKEGLPVMSVRSLFPALRRQYWAMQEL